MEGELELVATAQIRPLPSVLWPVLHSDGYLFPLNILYFDAKTSDLFS